MRLYAQDDGLGTNTIECMERDFIELINGSQASLRRALLGVLAQPSETFYAAEREELQALIQLTLEGTDYVQALVDYLALLQQALERLQTGFKEACHVDG